jgi:hypothetical protein
MNFHTIEPTLNNHHHPLILKVNNTDIALRQTGTLMYLGSQYDLDIKGQSQFDHHQLQLDRHLHAIRHRPAPINSKIYVLQSTLIPRLTYTSQFVPPTPLQLEVMDKKILKWGQQILRLTPTFPTAVLSSPHLLQLPMPSDAIQISQIRCFWRSQTRRPRQAAVTNRLLQRALNQQANYTTNPNAATPL